MAFFIVIIIIMMKGDLFTLAEITCSVSLVRIILNSLSNYVFIKIKSTVFSDFIQISF